jgi:hypothetical protein
VVISLGVGLGFVLAVTLGFVLAVVNRVDFLDFVIEASEARSVVLGDE